MADASSKLAAIERRRDEHVKAMEALLRRQHDLLREVIERMDRERAEKIQKDLMDSM
jgi:hypothetical protein